MVLTSPLPAPPIPKTDVLSYLFPSGSTPSETPIWLEAANPDNSLSPRQMLQWVKRLALGLDRLGVAAQEVVMILTPNHIFVPAAYLGIVGSRRIFSAANPIYTASELTHQIKNTGARTLLVHPDLLTTALAAATASGLPHSRIFQFSDRPNAPSQGIPDWRSMLASPADADLHVIPAMTPQEAESTIATVNYSSGTTGLPKGVCVSHYNLVANAEQHMVIKYHGTGFTPATRPDERWVGFLPLYHAYGQLWYVIMATKLNLPLYVMRQFQFAEFLRVIQTYRITHLHTAPPILVMLSKRPETKEWDISSVKHILCGAAPLSRELQNDITRRFGIRVTQGWGMTEVTCGAMHVPFSADDDTGSVGLLDPGMECKLLDEDGKEVAQGEPGEIYVRGPNVCLGYWRNEEATKESLSADGWLKTGDIAIVNKEGWFWIVDRKKELIKVNALQVAPAELEAALLEHEAVADAACVGVTLHGEEWPRGYVVLKEEWKGKVGEADIHKFMKVKVAKHKQLVGGVAFVDEVPKLASGKIVRKLLKEWAKRDAPVLEGKMKARL
ncbi:4-coumarate-CoA ligase [Trichodelitschia bisporula]|uniref:4-coumarate-CoA ligase n=1 Tax=Trichodelitschia bisporula TaxID=703511 RepID=A0A6G1I892_9PEZI|nr:4-coumarate-CoA ligase [Trichodelitschia bisporula]